MNPHRFRRGSNAWSAWVDGYLDLGLSTWIPAESFHDSSLRDKRRIIIVVVVVVVVVVVIVVVSARSQIS